MKRYNGGGGLSSDRRVSAAVACAVGAAKMEYAVKLWVEQLTDEEIVRVRRKLCEIQNWRACDLWNEKVAK